MGSGDIACILTSALHGGELSAWRFSRFTSPVGRGVRASSTQFAAIRCDNFQVAVLMNRIEYNQKKRSNSCKMLFHIRVLLKNWVCLCGLPGVQYTPVTFIGN